MKKQFLLLGIFLLLSNFVLAGNDLLRDKVEQSPLDCANYLLANKDERIRTDSLAWAFFRAKRYDDALGLIERQDKIELLIPFAAELFKKGDTKNAEKFVRKALEAWKKDKDDLPGTHLLIPILIYTDRADIAAQIVAQEDFGENKVRQLLAAAEASQKAGQKDNALKYLQELIGHFENIDWLSDRLKIAGIFYELGENDKALEVFERIEASAAEKTDAADRHNIYSSLTESYLRVAQQEKAHKLWATLAALDEPYFIFPYASALISSGSVADGRDYLSQLEAHRVFLEVNGDQIVSVYLELNDVTNAYRVARKISAEDDSYHQQKALMLVADKFIADGKKDAALEVLSYAFQKARRVGETHRTQDSNGASPLTRKIIYLRQLKERYLRLKRFDKISDLLAAFKVRHDFISEFTAQTLLDLAVAGSPTLPRKNVLALFSKAQKAIGESSSAYDENELAVAEIDAYAKIGEKTRALGSLARMLGRLHADDSSYLDDFLLRAGEVFEENKLMADGPLKKILREIAEDNV